MSLSMRDVDGFIDATIARLASEAGTMRSNFYVDLRSYQQRITQNLVDQCATICESRGLVVTRNGDGLVVTVDLHTCFLNPDQAKGYQMALNYTRSVHGNQL
jgi:hypothetical protein